MVQLLTASDKKTQYYRLAEEHRKAIADGDFDKAKALGVKLKHLEHN